MKFLSAILGCILLHLTVYAQDSYSISGTVTDAAGKRIQSATVFIAGSQKVTMSGADGAFSFKGISSGNYQLVVTMLGYESVKKTVVVNGKAETVDISLGEKPIALQPVLIGAVKPKKVLEQQKTNLKIFIKKFLGETGNAKDCKILNPDILEFSTESGVLKAATYDFLEIDNVNLGYHIKYLLKTFEYDEQQNITYYDGDCIFESLDGTLKQKEQWAANRKKSYNGSLMHFLRSVYANKSRDEGFLIYLANNEFLPLLVGPNPVVAEQVVKHLDENFITFRYQKRIYVVYDKQNTKYDKVLKEPIWTMKDMPGNASLFMVNTQIDRRGSFADYGGLSVQGAWVKNRIGEQLPLEYEPE